jgi:hypothetical protein
MSGLMWLDHSPYGGSWPFCLTFVRGAGEREVLSAFGADPAGATLQTQAEAAQVAAEADLPVVCLIRCGDWLCAVEENVIPQGVRPEVLRRVSAKAEAVAIFQDIGKLNHEFAYAVNGEVRAAVETSVPPNWWGREPDLLPVARETHPPENEDGDGDPISLETLLAMAEEHFGLSLDETSLDQPWPSAVFLPILNDLPAASDGLFRVGDPVVDLLMSRATDDAVRAVLSVQTSRLLGVTRLADDRELSGAVRLALDAGDHHVTDDDPVGRTLRRVAWERQKAELDPHGEPPPGLSADNANARAIRRGQAAWVLRFVLAGRYREALAANIDLQRSWQATRWREQALADLGEVEVSADEMRVAEELRRAQPAPVPMGLVDPGPVAAHVQHLIGAGMDPERIASAANMTTLGIERLLRGVLPQIPAATAQAIMAIRPPQPDS